VFRTPDVGSHHRAWAVKEVTGKGSPLTRDFQDGDTEITEFYK